MTRSFRRGGWPPIAVAATNGARYEVATERTAWMTTSGRSIWM